MHTEGIASMHQAIIPLAPPDAAHAVQTCQQYLARCQTLLEAAQTAPERAYAQFWIINAERQLDRWRAIADREVPR